MASYNSKSMKSANLISDKIIQNIPQQVSDTDIFVHLYKKNIDWKCAQALKESYEFNDEELANLLNISVKTFRSYKKPDSTIDPNVKEPILLLLSLALHGKKTFGSQKNFDAWLRGENFYFDGKAPFEFLNTISGIRFIDDRLTAMEYGDNA